jgi:hypothetical protein
LSLKKYYNTLGLQEGATAQEVRKRYRLMAMKYHPDKNEGKEAAAKFILITEAYEVLTGKRENPVPVTKTRKSSKEKHEERVKEARKRYEDQKFQEELANERYYQSLIRGRKWRIIRLNAYLGAVISVMLLLDVFLPRHYEEDRIEYYARDIYSGINGSYVSLVQTHNQHDIWIGNINFSLYAKYPDVYIERSWFFHDPIQVISIQKLDYSYFPVYYTFYSVTFLMIAIFLLPLVTILSKRRTIGFTIIWHLSLYLTGSALLLFLITNDHWAHLLTFGFI